MQRQGEELGTPRPESLGAEWLHPEGQPGEDRVAGDVGKGDGHGTGGKLKVTQAAQEEHRHHRSGVEDQGREDDREG